MKLRNRFFLPQKISLKEFIKKSKFVFLGLHGGDGENGKIQKFLVDEKVKFNGSGEKISHLCMDKFATGEFIRKMNVKDIVVTSQKIILLKDIKKIKLKIFGKNLNLN